MSSSLRGQKLYDCDMYQKVNKLYILARGKTSLPFAQGREYMYSKQANRKGLLVRRRIIFTLMFFHLVENS